MLAQKQRTQLTHPNAGTKQARFGLINAPSLGLEIFVTGEKPALAVFARLDVVLLHDVFTVSTIYVNNDDTADWMTPKASQPIFQCRSFDRTIH